MTHPPASLNGAAPGGLKSAAGRVLDLLLPPQCLSCDAVVEDAGTLCAQCWEKTRFLSPPWCACCGLPFAEDPGPDALCGACHRRPPSFARARAVMVYDERSRRLVLAYKHGDRTDMAPAFAKWMIRAGAELVADAELVAPVPLHWTRLFRRRFNQAALIARELGRAMDTDFAPDLLVRKRRTPSQAGLGYAGRKRNVRGAFKLAPGWRTRVKGRRVLLVDDVMTTGATAEACARALMRAGAGGVDVLTLARVVRPVPDGG